jgi:ferredoxin
MAIDRTPHPKNALGDFYVEHGCCVACGLPEAVAPEHFAFDDDGQCYVKKQPSTEAETERMLEAMWASEASCVRYRGREPAIFARLGAMGEPALSDFPPAGGIPTCLRNHVAFGTIDRRAADPEEAVADFRSFWMGETEPTLPKLHHRFRGPHLSLLGRQMWFEIAWYKDRYHRIFVSKVDRGGLCVLFSHSRVKTVSSRGISNTLKGWLTRSKRFGEQQWFTAREWKHGTGGSAAPW